MGGREVVAFPPRPSGDRGAKRSVRYRKVPGFAGIEAITALGRPPGWTEFHDTFTVCTMESGPAVSYQCGSARFERKPGVGMLMGPSELHADRPSTGPADYRVLRIAPWAMMAAARRLGVVGDPLVVARRELRNSRVNDLMLALHRALDEGAPASATDSLVEECLAAVVRCCTAEAGASVDRQEVRRVREHVLAHLGERLTLTGLGQAVGMGKWALISTFRRNVGVPPLRYALQVRLARARALLAAGRACVDVASEAGFFDQSHLNRWFTRTYGITPGEYQRVSSTPEILQGH